MSREIKFRGMTKANNVMVFGDLIYCPNGENRMLWFELKGELPLDVDYNSFNEVVQSNTIGQFTGLKDKNEKEIYEGDIVTYDRGVGNWTGKRMSTTHTIVFSEEVFAFVMDYGSSYIKLRKHWNYIYEVIGNIYENPELLSTPTAVL